MNKICAQYEFSAQSKWLVGGSLGTKEEGWDLRVWVIGGGGGCRKEKGISNSTKVPLSKARSLEIVLQGFSYCPAEIPAVNV